ncbi:MAG: restriction endonuclease subunit S [Turicibacter sp.]|nr:restriction endonuclease subunit S [Turicibacter sp.]
MSFKQWEVLNLEDICVSITDGAHSSPKSVENGYPMASVKDMNYFEINLSTCRQISEEDYLKLVKAKCKPEKNDILIAKDGSYLKHVHVVKEEKEVVILSSIAILKPNIKKIYPEFLRYYLLSPRAKTDLEMGYVSGSAIRRIVLKDFKRFPVQVPSIGEQKAIAAILSSLDDKIELNNQMNETLEEMAQALFKRWFVDFEFPNEEGQPYKSSSGEMVESELGMIPKGWAVKGLGELINISSGKRPSKKSSEKDKEYRYPLIGASSVMGYVLEPLCEDKILVIGRVGTHGVVQRFCGPVWPSDNTLVIRTVYYEFINQILQKIDYSAINRGSTQPLITQTDIKNTKIIVPDKNLLKVYEEKCESLFNMIEHNELEKVYLGSLRDSLLPKLMSGEIRVSDLC